MPKQTDEIPLTGQADDPDGTPRDSKNLFDEMLKKALGGADAFDESNAGAVQEQKAPEDVPLEARLKSSSWDLKVHGLNELKTTFATFEVSEIPSDMEKYSEDFAGWLSDRNANIQKAAVETVAAFFERCSPSAAATAFPTVLSAVYEKCIHQPRLLPSCTALIGHAFAVLEPSEFHDPVIAILDKFVDKKGNAAVRGPAAKQMTSYLNALEKLMRAFGAPKFDVKSILPRVSKYAAVTDNPTKQAAYSVLVEVFAWLKSTELVTAYLVDKQKVRVD